jgi:Protein of unknown function (DUF3352)
MRTMRVAWAVLVSMLVLVGAGCGSGDVSAGGPSAAEELKPGALVYWETVSDPGSDQWEQVEELIRRFPDGEKWLAELEREVESETELTWEDDVKPALGGRLAVAAYGRSMDDLKLVGLMNPDDPDKTLELVEKLRAEDLSEPVIARKVGEWVAISDKESSIDAALTAEGGDALADEESFKAGMEQLPDDALSRIYFDVAAALDAFAGENPEFDRSLRMFGLGELEFAGAWAKARDDGAELAGVLRGEGADKLLGASEPYTSKLLDLVPADAFAFASIQGEGVTAQLEALRGNPLYAMAFREVEDELGVSIQELIGLVDGEVAFYGSPAAPIPALTLLLDAEDPAQARESANRMLRRIAERAGAEVTEDADVTTAVLEGVSLNLTTVENTLVLTTSKSAIEDLRGSGDKLASSDRYKDALDAAGVPDEYTGLLYINLVEAIDLIMGFSSVSGSGIPPELSRNLEPLRSVVSFGEKDGDLGKSLVFVEIE